MPSLPSGYSTSTFFRANDLPDTVWQLLESHARNANVILPQAMKIAASEKSQGYQQKNLWITCASQKPPFSIEFILACTEGFMGPYPVFIMSTLPFDQLTDDYIRPCVEMLAKALRDAVTHVERVYSIFAPEPIAKLFADTWTGLTGIESYASDPYYSANITYCTRNSFVSCQTSLHPSLASELRPAIANDINEVAELCFGFADEAPPFQLTRALALREATYLVTNGLVWVHCIRNPGQNQSGIASIVAFTRNSESIATITKVYTSPDYRGSGYAERLVRRVCRHLLQTKENVVLYVAHDNPGAAKVYRRVGFLGLAKDGPAVDGVNPWMEIGFDRSQVRLGHW